MRIQNERTTLIKYNNKCNTLMIMIKSTLRLVKILEIYKALWGIQCNSLNRNGQKMKIYTKCVFVLYHPIKYLKAF